MPWRCGWRIVRRAGARCLCRRRCDVADVAGGNSGGGVAGAGSGESGVWHKTVICWLVLVAYLYIQCENYAFAALPLLVFAASKVRREPDFSRADASTRPEMDQNPE